MKKQLAYVVATGLAAVVWSAGAAANLVSNGSFETPVISNGSPGVQTVSANGTAITGWTVGASNSVDIVRQSSSGPGAWANAGNQAIDMSGSGSFGPADLFQTITTTVGQNYLLSLWTTSNDFGTGNPSSYTNGQNDALSVKWGNSLLNIAGDETFDAPKQGTWAQYQFTVTGTGSDVLTFKGLVTTASGALVDNVSLTAVPLPPAIILFGSVLFGFATMARKRRVGEGALAA